MENAPLRAGAFVAGGLFIGVWLFLGLFQTEMSVAMRLEVGLWWFWGFIGLLIAAGLFAGRVASANVRIAVWVTLGIAVGMLIGAALFKQIGEATAALFTAGGGAIIVTALPGMQRPDAAAPAAAQSAEPQMQWREAEAPAAARPRTRRSP